MPDSALTESYRALRRGLRLRLLVSSAFFVGIVAAGWNLLPAIDGNMTRGPAPAVAPSGAGVSVLPSASVERTGGTLAEAIRGVAEPQPLEGKSLEVLGRRPAEETSPPDGQPAPDKSGADDARKAAPAAGKLPKGPHLQAGIFASPANAEDMKKKLEAEGYPVYLETRVHVGPFPNRKEADKVRDKLKEQGMTTLFIPQ